MNQFNIGDNVFRANYAPMTEVWIECPECAGTLAHEIILGCGDRVSIDCAECGPGYNPPTGKIRTYEPVASVNQFTVTGMEIREGKTRYYSATSHVHDDYNTFATHDEAMERAEVLVQEHREREAEKVTRKEKSHKSWAFNASYHRENIKRCERDIEYHKAKLAVASVKAKEPEHPGA